MGGGLGKQRQKLSSYPSIITVKWGGGQRKDTNIICNTSVVELVYVQAVEPAEMRRSHTD